jgi:hypothetical protein
MTDTTTGATTELIQGLRDIQQSIENVVAEMLADPRLNQGNAYNPVGGERGMIELAGQWIPEAIEAISRQQPGTDEWISVRPTQPAWYLVWDGDRPDVFYFHAVEDDWYKDGRRQFPSHWMPLPTPPQAEGRKE